MTSESELCVDRLLESSARIDQLLLEFANNPTPDKNNLLFQESRELITSTQNIIDYNKTVIPGYILKKSNDSLRKLQRQLDESTKPKLKFKFTTSSTSKPENFEPTVIDDAQTKLASISSHRADQIATDQTFFGFRNKTSGHHVMNEDDSRSKDISLIDMKNCKVSIFGLANTVYISNLEGLEVSVLIACRAIKIVNCRRCHFKLVCQQLRIDSTEDSQFEVYTSARSMLESSKQLTFKQINPDSLDIGLDTLKGFMAEAKFDIQSNNWKQIDDFDWLTPDKPSNNYKLT